MQAEHPALPEDIAVKRIDCFPGRPTLVFLHDSLGCIELWRDFPEKIGEMTGCNVLVYDRQGYGKSSPFSTSNRNNDYLEKEAVVLHDLLNRQQIDQAILFGHSDGGSIALIFAALYPEKTLGLITEGAHIFVEEITLDGIKEAIHLYQTTNLKARLEKYHGDKTEQLFWAWVTTWTSDDFRTWNIEHFLPSIQCPALIIQGETDEYGTLKQVEDIVKGIGQKAEKYMLPDTGHTPHKEKPEAVLEKVAGFVRKMNRDSTGQK